MEVIYSAKRYGTRVAFRVTLQFIKQLQAKRGWLILSVDDLIEDYLENFGYTNVRRVE